MDWTTDEGKGGYSNDEKLENGRYEVEIFKNVHARGDGTKFISTSGHPKVLIIMRDTEGRECSCLVTLSEKAQWLMKAICKYAGMDVDQMTRDKTDISEFADPAFCNANLIGRRLQVEVKDGRNGYKEVVPVGFSTTLAEPTEPVEQVEEKEEVKLPF